jgi:hypothetical protein
VIYSATVLVYLILSAIPSAVILQEPIYQMLTQVLVRHFLSTEFPCFIHILM